MCRPSHDKEQIIGEIGIGAGGTVYHAAIWENGQITDLGPSTAKTINNKGQVAGTSNNRAVLWEKGQVTDLESG